MEKLNRSIRKEIRADLRDMKVGGREPVERLHTTVARRGARELRANVLRGMRGTGWLLGCILASGCGPRYLPTTADTKPPVATTGTRTIQTAVWRAQLSDGLETLESTPLTATIPEDSGLPCSPVGSSGCPSGEFCQANPGGNRCQWRPPKNETGSCRSDADCVGLAEVPQAICFVGPGRDGRCISRPCVDGGAPDRRCARYEVPGHTEPLFDSFPTNETTWPPNHPYVPMHRPGYSDPGPCHREGAIWHCDQVGGVFQNGEVRVR